MVVKDHRTIQTADVAVSFGLLSYSSYVLTTTEAVSSVADADVETDYLVVTTTEWVVNVLSSSSYFSAAVAATTTVAAKKICHCSFEQ